MLFTKMQACGNDYIYINNDVEKISEDKFSTLSKSLSNRNYGIGSDGVIFIYTDNSEADVCFRIFNPDGSEAAMCGNGIRCVARYAYEKGIVTKERILVRTKSGIRIVTFEVVNGEIKKVKVNMGKPNFNTRDIGVKVEEDVCINKEAKIMDKYFYLTTLSIGNLHTIAYVDDVDNLDVEYYGKEISNLLVFPDKTNVEFVQILDNNNLKIRVYERGVGETLACGSGATAAAVCSYLNGAVKNKCNAILKGGVIEVEYDDATQEAIMIGDANFVFEGEINIDKLYKI